MTNSNRPASNDPVDDSIRAALRAEQADLLRDLEEPGIFSRIATAMRLGPRWVTAYVFTASIALMAVGIWCGIRLFAATEVRELVLFATGLLAILMAILAMKVWFWMQMEKYVLLREVKRLELQVARLVERIGRAGT